MHWKLILLLSLIAPVLSFSGIYGIPGFVYEPYVVLVLFMAFSALFVLRSTGKYFLHGFIVAIIFGLLMSVIRLQFLALYTSENPEAVDKVENFLHQVHFIRSPMMVLACMIIISSLICGIICWLLAKVLRKA